MGLLIWRSLSSILASTLDQLDVSRAAFSAPGDALLDTLHLPIAGIDKSLRASAVPPRVQLKVFEILGLTCAQTTILNLLW